MTKEEIRILYKQKRRKIADSEKEKLEDLMLIQFQKIPQIKDNCLMSFAPITAQNEYNPYLPEAWYHLFNKNIAFVYPKMYPNYNSMEGFIVDEDTPFETNEFGVDEPFSVVRIRPEDIDIMFVPLIAFDVNGHRVGYGKGYYDKYIKLCNLKMVKIGFSFFEPVSIDDINAHDMKLNYCVTPQQLYTF